MRWTSVVKNLGRRVARRIVIIRIVVKLERIFLLNNERTICFKSSFKDEFYLEKKFFLLHPSFVIPLINHFQQDSRLCTRGRVFRTKFEWIIRGEEDRIVGHRSLDNGLLIRSIHLPQILSPRFIRPHHVYHVPFYRTSELRSLSNPPLTCW